MERSVCSSSDRLSLDVPAQFCSQLSQDADHFWSMAETWRVMRSAAKGDDFDVARAEMDTARVAVTAVLDELSSLGSRVDRYESFYRAFLRNDNLEATVGALEGDQLPFAHAMNVRLDHVHSNGRWLFKGDFNNKAQGWSGMHMGLMEDQARALLLTLWKRFRTQNDRPPRNILLVHGRHRDDLGFETVNIARLALAMGLFPDVALTMDPPDFEPAEHGFALDGKVFDVCAVFGGPLPPAPTKDDRGVLFPERRCESLADRKWEVMEIVARFARDTGLPIALPRSATVDHAHLDQVVESWGGEEGIDLLVFKNGMAGSGKGVYFAPPDAEACEHARALFNLYQLREFPDCVRPDTFSRILLQEAVHGELMDDWDGVTRVHDCTPRVGLGVPLGSVGRLARMPYDRRIAQRVAAFFRANRKALRGLAALYDTVVTSEGVPLPDASRVAQTAESFERVMHLYNELRGVFIVSGARMNPDGSQAVDASRFYSAFTDRHRLASYLKEGDPLVEMARLYRQSALVSVAVDLWLEEN